jgi:hypothetical protein
MSVIIGIQGRDAIPIRAIPLLTDWTVLAPLELAVSLSNKGGSGEIHGLTSYRLDGVDVKPIKPSWWIDAAVAVDSIEEVSKANNASYREWQLAAIQTLPEAAFVWRDEFEVCFSRSFLDQDSDSASDIFENGKPALLGLNFSPFIERDMLALVMQGFQHLVRPEQTADATPEPARRLAALRALGGTVKYKNCEWTFTGIGKLVQNEKGRPRCDVKTIRCDLKEAAQAERDSKSAGHFQGLGGS